MAKYGSIRNKIIILFSSVLINALLIHSLSESYAQAQNNCESELREAEDKYRKGFFDEAIDLLDRCLNLEGISKDQRMQAYRLKGLAYIAKDYLNQAKESIKNLLELVPDYKPNPEQDPPAFRDLVEELKEEQEPEPPLTQPTYPSVTPDQIKKPAGNKLGFSLGAGLSLPISPEGFQENFNPGANLGGSGDYRFRISPQVLLSIGAYLYVQALIGKPEVDLNVAFIEFYGVGKLIYQPQNSRVGFYLLAGIGSAVRDFTSDAFVPPESETVLMYNLGLGLEYAISSSIGAFVEAHANVLSFKNDLVFGEDTTVYVPLRAGLTFYLSI